MGVKNLIAWVACIGIGGMSLTSQATLIDVTNPGFEDTSGQSVFNEFTFGEPAGWAIHDPNGIVSDDDVFTGTLGPNGTDFFNTTAPEGVRVALLFARGRLGEGEYGYTQTLASVLQPNTEYNLSVEVGNIASGTDQSGTFFNLDEFPGYRVELLAGGVVIAQDNNSLGGVIPEAEFMTATVPFTTGAAPPQLGLALGIRLVNLNLIPAGFTAETSPNLEVDYDNVLLDASGVIPEPNTAWMVLALLTALGAAKTLRPRHA